MLRKIVFFAFFAISCYAANFTTQHGKLKVSGGKILDKDDKEIVLRGMSMYWYNGPWGGGQPGNQFYTSAVVSGLANDWGANLVRAAIGDKSVSMAKNMMDWAYNAGIYVIIDNHSHNAHNETSSVQNFFKDVSAYVKEKKYTHVLYEIYNEPLCSDGSSSCSSNKRTTWPQIKTFAESVISTIRGNDPDGLIIVGTPNWSSDISTPRGNPLTGKNILYALHFYAGETGHGVYRYALQGAYCNDFPIFVTEWGASPADGGKTGPINTSNSNTWINLLEAAKVSHANWSLSNTNESSAALYGTSITNNLTPSGEYVKNLMRLNSGSSLSDVGLTQQTINCSGTSNPSIPDGKVSLNSNSNLANFADKNGADSSEKTKYGYGLINTSKDFTASYTIVNIEIPGTYLIEFYYANTAGGTVSWEGNHVSSGQAQLVSTGSLEQFQYTGKQVIQINDISDPPLNLSFNTPAANSLLALWIYVHEASAEDSVLFNIVPIRNFAGSGGKHWNYDAVAHTFFFESNEGFLTIYNLRGERKASFVASGRISLKEQLPSGAYLAVYRRGSETYRRTIYLK